MSTIAPYDPATFTPQGRAAAEARLREQLASEECVGRCALCPNFRATGTSLDVIAAQARHRLQVHPVIKPERTSSYTKELRRKAGLAAGRKTAEAARPQREAIKPRILDHLRTGPKRRPELRALVSGRGLNTAITELRDDGVIRLNRHTWELVEA